MSETDNRNQKSERNQKLKSIVLKGHEKPITKLELLREGDYFVSSSSDKTAMLWKVNGLECMGVYTTTGAVSSSSISIDGTKLYLSCRDGSIFLFELETGKRLFSKNPIPKSYQPVKYLELSPNNEKLMSVLGSFKTNKSSLVLSDLELKNESEIIIEQEQPQLTKAKWLNNNVVVCGDELGYLFVKDIRTKEVTKFESHKNEITDIESDYNDILLGTTGKDGKAFVHDIRQPKDVISTFESGYPLQSIGFTPYTDYYAVGGGQDKAMITMTQRDMTMLMTTFVNAVNGEEIVRLPGHFGTVNTIVFSHDGKTIFTGADDGIIRVSPLTHPIFEIDY